MENKGRKELINKIVLDKGVDAVTPLLKLLQECEDDEQTAEIIRDTLVSIGRDGIKTVRKYVTDMISAYNNDFEKYNENYSPFCSLFLADVIAESGDKKDIKLLNDMVSLYDEEKAHLIIYEAIAMLGGGEDLLELVEYLIFEDDYKEEYIDQCVMILSYVPKVKAISILVKAFKLSWIENEVAELIKNAISRIIISNPDLIAFLRSTSTGKEIYDDITVENHGDELN